MRELIGVAHAHLRNALDYTLLIPGSETGIRRFCLWAIGLAVLTLQKISKNPGFTAGSQVKISRSAVAMTRFLTDLSVRNDWLLRRLFAQAARGLPLARLAEVRRPQPDLGLPSVCRRIAVAADQQRAERARRRSYGSSGLVNRIAEKTAPSRRRPSCSGARRRRLAHADEDGLRRFWTGPSPPRAMR